MFVSPARPSDTASTGSSTVVVGGWLLTMAAVAAFAFASGDHLRDGDNTVLVGQAVATYEQDLSATAAALTALRTSSQPATTDIDATTNAHPCGVRSPEASTASTATATRVSTRELTARTSHSRSGASISRVSATACRVSTSQKLGSAEVSAPGTDRAAGASRPVRPVPTAN